MPPHAESFINWGYDAMSRVTSETNELGQFDYTYVDDTPGSSKGVDRLASIAYPSANNQDTNFTWYPNLGDQRLQRIENLTGAPAELSRFTYGYNAAGEITQWYQRQNSTNTHRTTGYDLASQLTSAPTDSGSNTAVTVTASSPPVQGQILTIKVLDYGLSNGFKVKDYTIQSTDDDATEIATNITTAINADTDLSGIGVTATSSSAVITLISSSARATQFTVTKSAGATSSLALANPTAKTPLGTDLTYTYDTGSNRTTEVVGGTTTTFNYDDVNALTSITGGATLTYDKNGNMTSDGTNTYAWDAENRLLKITYTGSNNFTDFVYDAWGKCAKIIETTNNSVTSTKQFVWDGNERCEERDGSNNLTRQYFDLGQINISGGSPTNYFYTKDHLGSVREVTNSSAAIQAQYSYDPFGRKTNVVSETIPADFQYAGMYKHERSGMNLTLYRAYKADLGRWISRDPVGEVAGTNRFAYVENDPIGNIDALGLMVIPQHGNWGGQGRTNGVDYVPPQGGKAAVGWRETDPFPRKSGQKGFKPWTDPLDKCFYDHDVCLYNASMIGGSSGEDERRKCNRTQCDRNLVNCMQWVRSKFQGMKFGGKDLPNTEPLEQAFDGKAFPSKNENQGEYVPSNKPMDSYRPTQWGR